MLTDDEQWKILNDDGDEVDADEVDFDDKVEGMEDLDPDFMAELEEAFEEYEAEKNEIQKERPKKKPKKQKPKKQEQEPIEDYNPDIDDLDADDPDEDEDEEEFDDLFEEEEVTETLEEYQARQQKIIEEQVAAQVRQYEARRETEKKLAELNAEEQKINDELKYIEEAYEGAWNDAHGLNPQTMNDMVVRRQAAQWIRTHDQKKIDNQRRLDEIRGEVHQLSGPVNPNIENMGTAARSFCETYAEELQNENVLKEAKALENHYMQQLGMDDDANIGNRTDVYDAIEQSLINANIIKQKPRKNISPAPLTNVTPAPIIEQGSKNPGGRPKGQPAPKRGSSNRTSRKGMRLKGSEQGKLQRLMNSEGFDKNAFKDLQAAQKELRSER